MKVLWLCGIVLPCLCDEFGFKKPQINGWVSGMLDYIRSNSDVKCAICCPINKESNMKDGEFQGIKYYSFKMLLQESESYNQEERFIEIIKAFKPDVIHIWGTEYLHTYSMLCAAEKTGLLDKTVVNIQGFISFVARHYCDGIEKDKSDIGYENALSIEDAALREAERGEYELKSIKKCINISGRTDWDMACAMQLNPGIKYWHIGEILRGTFYKHMGQWSIEKCNRHSIFLSHVYCPIKGLHYFLKALPYILKEYPDTVVRIAGNSIMDVKDDMYGVYIKELAMELQVEKNIIYLGNLSEEEMYHNYMKANVFVCPSTIENSSNSLCEAMLIGTPVVGAYVGGIPSLITHGQDGFLYQGNEPEMLAFYVKKIFGDDDLSVRISKEAVISMSDKVNVEKNGNAVLDMYNVLVS